ncbi:NAD(P)H-binding protein [Chitinophaga flava]|uniref:NAD-dependent dehydratase n=1 Tax=Chitinophaga flava TaxID=2259036 RepID=A0A365XVA3_9BACT|nr:NAD(P)H-binding protein [Chitinophaga flava]RBL90292.1 NAD-dependent dehydratase [Chitinophaga flava]
MRYTITGSLGNISKLLVTKLVEEGHHVTLISSDPQKATTIKDIGAVPAIGDIQQVNFLTDAFSDADAVYTMVPIQFDHSDWRAQIRQTGQIYAQAIRQAGIKRVVNLSSIGAHSPDGCGPVSGLYDVEQTLNQLENIQLTHLRPANFYINFFAEVAQIRHQGLIGRNYPANTPVVMVDIPAIADAAATALTTATEHLRSIQYIVSDIRTAGESAAVLGQAIGRPELPWVEYPDNEYYDILVANGLPANIAANYIELGTAIRTGKLFEDFYQQSGIPKTGSKLEAFAQVFAAVYHAANV